MRVGVIDYGVGNLGSALRALELVGAEPVLLSNPKQVADVERLILPGVGHFGDCATKLQVSGWSEAVTSAVMQQRMPLLGICVGMQLLAHSSAEGTKSGERATGLGLVDGHVEHLKTLGCTQRVPHVGWNNVDINSPKEPLFLDIPNGSDFYFVHSFAFVASDNSIVKATVNYGANVVAAIRDDIVWGTQFHPEKSSKAGLRLLSNFVNAAC